MKIIFEEDKFGGSFVKCILDEASSRHKLILEKGGDFDAFVCSYRDEPFFMSAKNGKTSGEIPLETQWLGVCHSDGTYSVYFSLVEGIFRTSIYGDEDGIGVVALTGDENLTGKEFFAWYKISGSDFYDLVDKAAEAVCEKMGNPAHISNKKVPDFVDKFGWCTWDSFYEKVTGEDVIKGLENFKKEGFVPKFLILDDGWQTVNDNLRERGHWKLKSFSANAKFCSNLRNVVEEVKRNFGVEKFFVWHAVMGYWGGVDTTSVEMKKYLPRLSRGVHTQEIKAVNPERWESEYFDFGIVDQDKAEEFYADYHSYLKNQCVDGVKIDVQSALEAHASGQGGRVKLVKKYRKALEKSVVENFGGEMINCMSCSNDIIYNTVNTAVMRSSRDFYPEEAGSHTKHIYFNAINSIWMSRFVLCDWDMFQTMHKDGEFHAGARAISGGPVYVSDRVGEHNFEIINALCDDNGNVLRSKNTARPTEDCIFSNPMVEKTPFKLYNANENSLVVGVFSYDTEEKTTTVCKKDFGRCEDFGRCVVYSRKYKKLYPDFDRISITVKDNEFDILTMARVTNGFGTIGIDGKYNCGGTVEDIKVTEDCAKIRVNSSGKLICYAEKTVKHISQNGKNLEFFQMDNDLRIQVDGGTDEIIVEFL